MVRWSNSDRRCSGWTYTWLGGSLEKYAHTIHPSHKYLLTAVQRLLGLEVRNQDGHQHGNKILCLAAEHPHMAQTEDVQSTRTRMAIVQPMAELVE